MIKNNRNNEQIYGRNDMIMLDSNNKIYGSLGLADNYVMKTEEGTRLTLRNPKLGSFANVLTEFNMYGRSEQFSTTGAQLLNENIEKESRGVTVKINGSIATFEGTVSDEANIRVNCQKEIKLKPGKYTASSSNEKIAADFSVKKANNEIIYNSHIEIDGTEEVKIRVLFGLRPSAKGDVINETANIMLNDGDIALPYEPYTGGKPSPSPDYPQEIKSVGDDGSVLVKVTGKNLLNPVLLNSTYSVYGISAKQNSDGRYTVSGTPTVNGVINMWIGGGWSNTVPIFTIPPGNYYSNVLLSYYDGKNRTSKRNAFTLLEPFRVTGVMHDKEYAINEKYNFLIAPQLEQGSIATPYEPYYEEQTITIPCTLNAIQIGSGGNVTINGQQYIADYVDVERGKLYKKVKRINVKDVEDIDVSYGHHSNGNGYLSLNVENINTDIIPISNQYIGSKWTDKSGYIYIPRSSFIVIVDDRFTDRQTAIKLVQDTYVFCALASQIEINLAPEVIEQYKKLSVKAQTTIIENNYNTWMKATYKSTESV